MAKRHLHHFNRGLAIGFEIIGVCGILFLLGWGALIFRLSQGPMKVNFLTRRIERAVNADQKDYRFSVGATELAWGGRGHPFMFDMEHVSINRTDGTPVLSVEKIGVRLSKSHLLFGRVVPRVIRIYAPVLRIVRDEDGHFSLNVDDHDADDKDDGDKAARKAAAAPAVPAAENPAAVDVLKSLLARMKNDSRSSLLGGLNEVSVTGAAFVYQDKILGGIWKSAETDIVFARARGGLAVSAIASIGSAPADAAILRGDFYYNWQTRRTQGTVGFANLNPRRIAQQSPTLKALTDADVPLRGNFSIALDPDFRPLGGHFAIGSGAGTVFDAALFAKPLPVTFIGMRGQFDLPTQSLQLDSLRVKFPGPEVTGSGSVRAAEKGHAITFDAVLKNMPLDKLKTYWPTALAPDARGWVTGHLSAGTATKATLHLALFSPALVCLAADAAPWGDFSTPVVQHVGGRIDFHDIKVDYFPPLLPVKKVAGHATYDNQSFNLDISGGDLGDMHVIHSNIAITDLAATAAQPEDYAAAAPRHARIHIAVALKGPLKTALGVLAGKPLRYPQKLGLNVKDTAGDATVDVDFKFPLYDDLKVNEVDVTAAAMVDNVLLSNIAAGMALTGGPVALKLADGTLEAHGKGSLGTMPVTFDWKKYFSAQAPVDSRVKASLPLDAASLAAFNVPPQLQISGVVPATVTYTVLPDHKATLLFSGYISKAGFTVPGTGYTKQPKVGGTLGMTVHFKNGNVTSINRLDLETDRALVKGDIDFARDGKLSGAALGKVKLGATDVSVALARSGGTYDVSVSGTSFDASRFLSNGVAPKDDAAAAQKTTPIKLVMKVDRLVTSKGGAINHLNLSLLRNAWGRIASLAATGVSGGRPLKLSYTPGVKGHSLHFEADNAGAALSALGISDGVRGGKLTVIGDPDAPVGGRNMHGYVYLMNFSLVDVPVLGRLLNALSLGGFFELLQGKGIAFHKMRCEFWWTDKGEPQSKKNVRLITVRHGETSGASLGLTFKGSIDNWNNTVDMNGTIIPVSDINKMISFIPIVGNILTGGGNGVFAATYTVKGPKADPNVTVNPLSVLAPGILRQLFFEK